MARKAAQEAPQAPEAPATTLAEIFKQAGDKASLARAVLKALSYARNDYERRLIVLALEQYADPK